MADEISEFIQVNISRGGWEFHISQTAKQDQNSASPTQDVRRVTVTTTEATLTFANVTTPGVLCITNLHASNTIEYGFAVGALGGEIKPGETHKLRIKSGTTFRWKAVGGNTDVYLQCAED